MPAQKRSRDQPLQDSPPSKRHTAESTYDATSPGTTEVIELLKDCAQQQRDYIARMENVLESQEPRFERLQLHLQYHSAVEQERFRVQFFTKERIKEYEKRLSDYKRREMIEKMDVEEMEKQEEKLEKIVQDIVTYKGYRLQDAEKRVSHLPDSNPYGPYEQELKDALLNIPFIFRDDAKMETVPKLQKEDLDKIEWPSGIHGWRQFYDHWDSEFEEAAECRNLNEKINDLMAKLAEVRSIYEKALTKKDRIQLYDENRNCPIHGKKIRDAERTELTEQLEQLIKTSFEKKAILETLKAKERVLEASKKEREDLLKSIQEEMNTESLKCSVCFEALTNGEQSERCPQLFGSCGHTVCATCMQQFKARHSPYHWTCHQCRAPSDKILTNWALMQMIKEIPGQPQRVVVDVPAAIPIVPAPWRLEEQRRDPEPQFQEEVMENIMEEWNIAEMLERHMERFDAPVAPGPVVAPPRPRAPMGDPIALAPRVPLDREPDQEPNFVEDIQEIDRNIERHRRFMDGVDERDRAPAEQLPMFPPPRDLALMIVNPPPPPRAIAPVVPPPPFPLPEFPNFNPLIPPPRFIWQPVQYAQLFPAPWAPPPPPAPAPAAPNFDLVVPPPPPALWQPVQVPQLFPDLGVPPPPPPPLLHADEDDDDEEDDLHVAPNALVAPPPTPPAPQADPMDDDDVEVLEVQIRAPPEVRQPAVQIVDEIDYIFLD